MDSRNLIVIGEKYRGDVEVMWGCVEMKIEKCGRTGRTDKLGW